MHIAAMSASSKEAGAWGQGGGGRATHITVRRLVGRVGWAMRSAHRTTTDDDTIMPASKIHRGNHRT